MGFSHEKAGHAVAEYLANKGYRNIGLVWTLNEEHAAKRERGFLASLKKRGITNIPISRGLPPSTLRLGRDGLARLLNAGHRLDAVFCATDTLAQGVLTEAHSRGLSVPEDLAIMGFGDQDFAAHTFPALSTVHVDRAAIGRLAAEAILERLRDRPQRGVSSTWAFRLLSAPAPDDWEQEFVLPSASLPVRAKWLSGAAHVWDAGSVFCNLFYPETLWAT